MFAARFVPDGAENVLFFVQVPGLVRVATVVALDPSPSVTIAVTVALASGTFNTFVPLVHHCTSMPVST